MIDIQLEQLVAWAIRHGLATGHADTTQELLCEIGWQIDEMREKLKAIGDLQKWQAESFVPKTQFVQSTTDPDGVFVLRCDIEAIIKDKPE